MSLSRASVRNSVAVNLLMWLIVVGGVYYWFDLVREFFPNAEAEQVFVTVPYPGATPEEVEKSVVRRLERELEAVEDVEEIESKIFEGVAVIELTLETGADTDDVLNDVRSEIDKVKPDLPEGAEDPEIREARPIVPVIGVVVYGTVADDRLYRAARDIRDDLLDMPEISEVVVSGVRDPEIWAEVQPEKLEEHGLTFGEVGRAVAEANLDLPGGQLKSDRGNIRVRTLGEKERAREIEGIVVRGRPDGSTVRLRDVATVRETFEDLVVRGQFDQKPAALITVFKTPEQDALEIAGLVKDYVAEEPTRLGGALKLDITTDLARFIEQRLDLMKRNARIGVILVLFALALFLDIRVAFWVGVGLPIAFLGTFAAMSFLGASINLISLFGLIVVLGIIVDDAIVIGENFYKKLEEGMPPAQAAVVGTDEMARPVLAAVLTTIAAFLPLIYIEGRVGTFLGVLPIVVIAALSVSLIEAFVILPAHLGHLKLRKREPRFPRLMSAFHRFGRRRSRILNEQIPYVYEKVLRFALRWRYASIAAAFALSAMVIGLIAGGSIPFVLLQDTDAETVTMTVEMSAGTPEARTEEVVARMETIAKASPETRSVFATIGSAFGSRGAVTPSDPATIGQVVVELVPAEEREKEGLLTSKAIVQSWRRQTANIPGVSSLAIRSRGGGPQGPDIEIRVRGDDLPTVEKAVAAVRKKLGDYTGVSEIEDDLSEGKLEVRLELLDSARSLGLTTRDLALQLRHALFGFEAQDLQGEDEEITVRVVLPAADRREISDLSRLRVAAPGGGRVPLTEVASISTARGYASLARVDGKRAITVTAEVDRDTANVEAISMEMAESFETPEMSFPGVTFSFEGEKKETAESLGSLAVLYPVALFVIYCIIAILFRSYVQPFIVMAAIPYAMVGAVAGHWFMGYPITILSVIGIVALAGIVVNDSLILVDNVNRRRREGVGTVEAIVAGGRARMRPILLTSITTIFGIGPLMLERSFQAQFLIPMAVSIVFGLMFATVLTLVLLPTLYLVFEDLRAGLRWLFTGRFSRDFKQSRALADLDAMDQAEGD